MKLVFSSEALHDLGEIFDYIAADNVTAANKQLKSLTDSCELLREFPGLGRRRPELDALSLQIRSYPQGAYLILYAFTDRVVGICRVLHGARDIGPSFIEQIRDFLTG